MNRDLYRTVSDFLDDPHFRAWVLTGVDSDGWEKWMAAHPERRQLAAEARHFILAMGVPDAEVTERSTEDALTESLETIRRLENPVIRMSRYLKYAAAVLLFAAGIGWYLGKDSTPPDSSTPLIPERNTGEVFQNDTQVPQIVNLKDGSSVILQPGGELVCSAAYDSTLREVYLTGEGFFEVRKNPAKPFLVYAGEIVTRVVGTSFRIKAIEGEPHIEVFVKTGKVNIREIAAENRKPGREIALHPNESVSYLRERNLFEKSVTADIPKRAIEYLSFDFVDTPVAEIFQTIEKAYGVTIQYPREALGQCYLSTSLTDEPLLEKLKIICESLGERSSFTMYENLIVIKSNGCN